METMSHEDHVSCRPCLMNTMSHEDHVLWRPCLMKTIFSIALLPGCSPGDKPHVTFRNKFW